MTITKSSFIPKLRLWYNQKQLIYHMGKEFLFCWITSNFSPVICTHYIESTQTYQVKVIILIQHQILIIDLQGNVQQLQWRIDIQILGVQGRNTM